MTYLDKPNVSIIVTTYNRKDYLKETIQSILSQSYTDFELIIVDNYSNYDFYNNINEFHDNRIRAFQNHNNGVIAINRNFGLLKAIGNYVAFCDDDDLWENNKLEIQISCLKKNSKSICCSNSTYVDSKGEFLKVMKKKQHSSPYWIYISNNIILSTVLVEKSDLLHFDTDSKYKAIEDCALWTQLIHNGYKVKLINKQLIRYRISGGNFSFNKRYEPIKRIIMFSSFLLQYKNTPLHYYLFGVIKDLLLFVYYTIIKL